MRFAYADPPYPGRGHLYPEKEEVDHVELIQRLTSEYPDGWALSTDSRGLWDVMPILAPIRSKVRARLAVWHIPDAHPFGVGHPQGRDSRIGWGWEAVIFAGGRGRGKGVTACMDIATIHRTERNEAFIGQKPLAFTIWLCRMLGVIRGDAVDDLFPGSGAVGRGVEMFLNQPELLPVPRLTMRRSGRLRNSRGWATRQAALPTIDEAAG